MAITNLRPEDLDDYRTVVIALTGPPAAGKSTVAQMLSDQGVPVKDTGDAVREEARDRYDDPDEDQIWSVAESIREEHGLEGPTAITADWIAQRRSEGNEVVCVSSLRDQAEVDWLRENVGPTLVVRIDADSRSRSERYVEMKLGDEEEREAVSKEHVQSIREELYERELRESPYPDHDVTIRNEDSVKMNQVWDKLENLVEVMKA